MIVGVSAARPTSPIPAANGLSTSEGLERVPPIVPRVPVQPSSKSQLIEMPQPARYSVPTGKRLVHQPFISSFNRPQVAEGRRGYAGSNTPISVERDSVWKEQLLEPLPLFE